MTNNYLPVIPGLYGFGTDTRAAYGAANNPIICIVTDLTTNNGTLGDSSRNGTTVKTGSFLECVNYVPPANTGKIILFEVSGYIGSNTSKTTYRVNDQYVTIAGQTAPSPGVTLKHCGFHIQNCNIFVQHLAFRHPYLMNNGGQVVTVSTSPYGTGYYNVQNVVLDHISASWGAESSLLIANYQQDAVTKNVTVSNCIIGEGLLYNTDNYGKGSQASQQTENVAYIKNLFIHNFKRNPYTRSKAIVVVNDLVYNHGNQDPHSINADQHTAKLSYVGNIIKEGPWKNTVGKYIAALKNIINNGIGSELYTYDNRLYRLNPLEDYHQTNANDWSHVREYLSIDYESNMKVTSPPIWPDGLVAMDVNYVETHVIANAGSRPADRDEVDSRYINDVINGTGNDRHIISPPHWPTLAKKNITLLIPTNPHTDSGNGYTNLEKWLHELAAEVEGKEYDPCKGVVCDNICIDKDLWYQKCVDGDCVPDQLLESNSTTCGYDPCEGVVCENVCVGLDLWSQRCDPATGTCVPDQLIESNSSQCSYDPCEGVVCPNICVDDDLWSQRCDPDTGNCVPDQLLQPDSINCKIPDQVPSDESTINTYIILGGLGIMGLAILLLKK